MMSWIGLFIKYETVGKKLNPKKTHEYSRDQALVEDLFPQRSVIQFNSTYLELIDRWNYPKGFVTVLMSVFLFLFLFYQVNFVDGVDKLGLSIFILWEIMIVVMLGAILFCLFFLRRECFSYTHYPIRFNRKLRKVYVIQPNKTLLVGNWDDFHIGAQNGGQGNWDVRFSLLDQDGKVTDTFALPYIDSSPYFGFLLEHWEFVRCYMEGSPKNLKKAHAAVTEVFPIHNRKETIKESLERVYILPRGIYDEPSTSLNRMLFWGLLPLWMVLIVGRIIAIKTSRTPHLPDWVEAECVIDNDDIYDMDRHPKSKVASTPITIVEYIVYAVLVLVSIILVAGFIDLLSMAKGEDSGLLRMLFFWW